MRESFAPSEAPVDIFDVALLDLDGVVYIGEHAVDHAVPSLVSAAQLGMSLAYVTNNASRPPHVVAEHLRELGLSAQDADVVTSSQAGARVMSRLVAPGTRVLAVGGPGVAVALEERGLTPVRSYADSPEAVMQGFGKDIGWSELAEAAFTLAGGVPWVATNLDYTIPTPQGLGPGNGAFVGLLTTTTGRVPDVVAGKPERPLVEESILRTGALRPIMVGDRLDTDIEAATNADIPSLLVLTGVTGAKDLLEAPPERRPTLLSADLRGLLRAHPAATVAESEVTCGAARAWVDRGELHVDGPIDGLAAVEDLWRAAAVMAWQHSVETSMAVARVTQALRALL